MSDTIPRPRGCTCHQEAGDSLCFVHPPDPEELAYARKIGAPYRFMETAFPSQGPHTKETAR